MSKKEIEPRIDTYCEQQMQVKTVLAGKGVEFEYDDKNNMYINATVDPCGCIGDNGIVVENEVISLDNDRFEITSDEATMFVKETVGDDTSTGYVDIKSNNAIIGANGNGVYTSIAINNLGIANTHYINENTGESTMTDLINPVVAGDNVTIKKVGNQFKINAKGSDPTVVDNETITQTSTGALQTVAVKDTTDSTLLTATIMRKAMTIRRYK